LIDNVVGMLLNVISITMVGFSWHSIAKHQTLYMPLKGYGFDSWPEFSCIICWRWCCGLSS